MVREPKQHGSQFLGHDQLFRNLCLMLSFQAVNACTEAVLILHKGSLVSQIIMDARDTGAESTAPLILYIRPFFCLI